MSHEFEENIINFELPKGVNIFIKENGSVMISSPMQAITIEDPVFGPILYFVRTDEIPKIQKNFTIIEVDKFVK